MSHQLIDPLKIDLLKPLNAMGFDIENETEGIINVVDGLQSYVIFKNKGINIRTNEDQVLIAHTILPHMINLIHEGLIKENLVLINGIIVFMKTYVFPDGNSIETYIIKYDSSSIMLELKNSNYQIGTKLAIVGTLYEKKYKDKEGNFKSQGTYIKAFKVEENKRYYINLEMVSSQEI